MSVFLANAPRGKSTGAPPETLVWAFGIAYRSVGFRTLNPEDVEVVGGNLTVQDRSNTWSGGPITTLCGLSDQDGGLTNPNFFGNSAVDTEVPELDEYCWFDGVGNTVDLTIQVPTAQAGSGWRIYAGWGNDAAATSTKLWWKDGRGTSANGYTLIGDYPSLPANSYAAINNTRYDGAGNAGALAWLADYDNQYIDVSITDQGANTGFTLRTEHNGLRQRYCHWRVRRYA